jgi:hypothetical protein
VTETRNAEPTALAGAEPAVVQGGTGETLTASPRPDGAAQPAHVVDPRGRANVAIPPALVVDPRGRAKVFRPLPAAEREAALARGLAAYAQGEFYLAHEELEPAWMGTADPAERELLAGLIKLAAAFVHASRGNPAGAATNLRGARVRLAGAAAAGHDGGFDVAALVAAIDDRLARLDAEPAGAPSAEMPPARPVPDPPHDVAGPPDRAHRPPLTLAAPILERRTRA